MQRNHFIVYGAGITAIIVGVLAFLYGNGNIFNSPCGRAKCIQNIETQSAAVTVPFTELAHGTRSNVSTRTNYLITSASEFEKLWKMVDATSTLPKIDFNTDAVIAVFAGKESNSAIAVAKVEDMNMRMVSVTLAKPNENCVSKQENTTPYEIIALSATTLPLDHKDSLITADCTR